MTTDVTVIRSEMMGSYAGSLHVHVLVYKRQGHQVLDTLQAVDHPLPIEQNTYGRLIAILHFQDDLPAGATGRNGFLGKPIGVTGGYGQGGYGMFGVHGLGGEDGAALCTQARRKGGVLLVGPYLSSFTIE